MALLTAKQTAERLGVTQQTVSRLAREGRLPSGLAGSGRLYHETDVTDYLARNNLSPAPADHARRTDDVPVVTAVSFFSGALGLDLGMERAGFAAQLMCENDMKCRMTIDSNRPEAALLGDITKLDADAVFEYAPSPASAAST